ncbi:MAG: hypothetical protein LLF89_10895, partial [Spirochaetaceae bacterium]|nr:hypothetical protein [Spirochaetaceae bacterium]
SQNGPVKPQISRPCGGALFAAFPWACGGIFDLMGGRSAELHKPEPNLNILYPRVLIPLLKGKIGKGKKILACAVIAARLGEGADFAAEWKEPPKFSCDPESGMLAIESKGVRIFIDRRSHGGLQ